MGENILKIILFGLDVLRSIKKKMFILKIFKMIII